MQDLPESQDTKQTSKQGVAQLSSSVKQLTLSPLPRREVQRIRDELKDCMLCSGVGVICENVFYLRDTSMKNHLSSAGYKFITNLPLNYRHTTLFPTIAQSIAPPAAAESSYSPPFVVAVFVTGFTGDSAGTFYTRHGSLDIVDDIIKPFLPQSAPHLQHIPKLFFISVMGYPHAPHFPDDPDGNYCVAYHMAVNPDIDRILMWKDIITDRLFHPGISVQEVIKNFSSQLDKRQEYLHYFTCLKKELVLKK